MVRFALAQICCPWGEVSLNLERIENFAQSSASKGAQIIVFPELTVSGIYKDKRVWDLAEPLNGPSLRRVSDLARTTRLTPTIPRFPVKRPYSLCSADEMGKEQPRIRRGSAGSSQRGVVGTCTGRTTPAMAFGHRATTG